MNYQEAKKFYLKNQRWININLLFVICILCVLLRNWLAFAGYVSFLYYYGVTTQ